MIDLIGKIEQDHNEDHHRSYLFPDLSTDIDRTCTFTSGAIDNFGTWAEVTDSLGNTLGDIAALYAIHITAVSLRSPSVADKLYVFEIGYGPDNTHVTVLDPHTFGSGTKHTDGDYQARFRPPVIPLDEKIWYRMKTEDTLNATVLVVFRYHPHERSR
jgi:hypothetical protein